MKHTHVQLKTDDPFDFVFNEPLAHITEDGRAHPLREHLYKTAERAAEFASVFCFRQWGWLSGLWHDLGKYAPDFQNKLRAAAGDEAHLEAKARVNHSTAGGLYAVERFGIAGRLLAYIAAGHHAGLPDWEADATSRPFSVLLKEVMLPVAEGA